MKITPLCLEKYVSSVCLTCCARRWGQAVAAKRLVVGHADRATWRVHVEGYSQADPVGSGSIACSQHHTQVSDLNLPAPVHACIGMGINAYVLTAHQSLQSIRI